MPGASAMLRGGSLGLLFAVGLAACATSQPTATPTEEVTAQATTQVTAAIVSPVPERKATPAPQRTATLDIEKIPDLRHLGWLAFTASEGGRRDVWLIRPDGSDEFNLTGSLANTFAEAPVWAPDGRQIAFDGIPNSDVSRDIYLVSVSRSPQQRPITSLPGFDCYPSFSPDGRRIVYMSEREGNRDLYIMDLGGNDILRLTDHAAYDYEPAWSPDGSRIVFASRRTGDSEIYIMNSDGRNLRRLTEAPGLDWRPSWSADGEWIVFESWRGDNADIYMMRPDGSELTQLTDSPAEDGHPTFSPDGRYIVFHSRRTGDYQLFILDVEDPELQWHIPTSSVRALLPAWSPVAELPALEEASNR